MTLDRLTEADIAAIVGQALKDEERGLEKAGIALDADALAFLVRVADGDARAALNSLEIAASLTPPAAAGARPPPRITLSVMEEAVQRRRCFTTRPGRVVTRWYAPFIKSMRGSDPDAALYWLARMLDAGEDPRFIARRMAIFASEDIGNADPGALGVAMNATAGLPFGGAPGRGAALVEAAVYLAGAEEQQPYAAHTRAEGGDRRQRLAAGAASHPQCPHGADEKHRLRPRL